MSFNLVRRISRASLGRLERLAEGTQGIVYRTENVRIAAAASAIFKEYKPEARRQIDVTALDSLVSALFRMDQEGGQALIEMAAWPVMTVLEGSDTTGFVMPEVPKKFFVPITLPSGKSSVKLAQFQFLLNKQEISERQGIFADDQSRLQLLATVAKDLSFLHQRGLAVGDLSPKNLLFSLDGVPDSHFVDCDAMALNGVSVMPQLETPDWKITDHNALETVGTSYSDVYKLSLLTLRLFLRDQSITDVEALPSWLKAAFRDIITASWSKIPENRPTAEQWAVALSDTCHRYELGTAQKARPTRPYFPPERGNTPTPSSTRSQVVPARGSFRSADVSPRANVTRAPIVERRAPSDSL